MAAACHDAQWRDHKYHYRLVNLFGFMTLWTFVDVYQSAMLGHMDRSGSLVALLPSVQGFGNFLGPNIAASILGAGLGYGTMFMVSGSMALVALVLYAGVFIYMHRRRSVATWRKPPECRLQIGTIESIWRYPVKGMRGEEVPHIYTAYTGLMGDRIYGVVAADGDPGHPWHTGRNQEEFVLYKARLRVK